jgi:pilus assembly protein CpaE
VTPSVVGSQPDAPGKVITVLSAKGGCGKTTFAINLALALHAEGAHRVCLVDLDLDSGDVANSLRLIAFRSLCDAHIKHPRTNRSSIVSLVASLATSYRSGFDCILAPVGPGDAERVPPGLVEDLLMALPQMYDYVIVDTPTGFPPHVLAALDHTDHQVLITTPEYPALKSLRMELDVLDLLSERRVPRSIVVSRTDPHVVLSAKQVEALVRSSIAGHVPYSWDVPASINRGIPILASQRNHPVGNAIRTFARRRIGAEVRTPLARPRLCRRGSARGWTA